MLLNRLLVLAALVQIASSEEAFTGGRCSTMRKRLEWLRTEIASLELQVEAACDLTQSSIEMLPASTEYIDARPQTAALWALPSTASAANTTSVRSTTSTAANTRGGRRRERDLPSTYSAQCYRAGSSFTDASCGCLGKPKSNEFDMRPTIKIVAGSWYVRRGWDEWGTFCCRRVNPTQWSVCVGSTWSLCAAMCGVCQASWRDRRLHPEDLDRAGAGIPHRAGARRAVPRDPFESHGAIERVSSARERRCSHVSRGDLSSLVRVPPPWLVFRVRLQVWHSEEAEWYDRYVRDAQSVLP
jgi:hypothetical protein